MPWVNQLDLSFQQELPGFWKEHKSIIRLDVYNFLNLLNDDWGLTKQIDGFDTRYLAELGGVNPDGSYVYDLGAPADPATGEPARPTWQDLNTYDADSRNPSRLVSRWSLGSEERRVGKACVRTYRSRGWAST